MKIAIITRPNDSSPKVLAQSLQTMLNILGIENQIFFESGIIMRLVKWHKKDGSWISKLKYLYGQIKQSNKIKAFVKTLKTFDLIVFSECSPNAFWRNYYNIEKLRKLTGKPIAFYEVYYLGNAPTQIEKLIAKGDCLAERFDWHFAVSEVTEIRSKPSISQKWSSIGLNLTKTNLDYRKKEDFVVLVDFEQKGYGKYRNNQIEILEKLNIPYIALSGRYPMEELRKIYNKVAACFIQFPEAFGVPIAELLATGSYIFTPDSSWPMSWRLDENPEVHGPGTLPDIFKIYNNLEDMERQLLELKQKWNKYTTSEYVFNRFIEIYPDFYYGNGQNLNQALEFITNG